MAIKAPQGVFFFFLPTPTPRPPFFIFLSSPSTAAAAKKKFKNPLCVPAVRVRKETLAQIISQSTARQTPLNSKQTSSVSSDGLLTEQAAVDLMWKNENTGRLKEGWMLFERLVGTETKTLSLRYSKHCHRIGRNASGGRKKKKKTRKRHFCGSKRNDKKS